VNDDSADPISEFRTLCEQAEIVYSHPESHGTSDLVPYGRQILSLIERHPERRSDFERAFCDLWQTPFGPWELISFCMHTLRWPVVRQFIERAFREAEQRQDWRSLPIASHILASFSDDWPDADLFHSNDPNESTGIA
jgi:hypothetical protein